MARTGSGTYTLPAGQPVVTGTTISSTTFNTLTNDLAAALTQSIAYDGQTTPVANLPMGGFRHTGVADGVNLTDYASLKQVQNSSAQALTGVSGTDTITATLATPTLTAYANLQTFRFVAAGANTTTSVTLNINGLGAKSVTKNGSTALSVGDIPSGAVVTVTYDGTQFQVIGVSAVALPVIDTTSIAKGSSDATKQVRLAVGGLTTATTRTVTIPDRDVDLGLVRNIQPISASVAANAMTVSASQTTLDFRSTTLGSGAVTTVSGTPANLVIPSGATLGTVNAIQSDIAVLELNNAGTLELAVVNVAGGVDLTETGLISTTAISAGSTSASTVYSTTARTSVAYRVVGIIRSTQATAGTWATAPSLIQGAGGQAMSSLGYGKSMVRLNTANGYGSTNTVIRRFTNTVVNQGSDITYADSATLGASFTINTPGVYAISYSDCFNAGAFLGVSLNSNQLTTSIVSITVTDVLVEAVASNTTASSPSCSWVGYLPSGAVLRAHTQGSPVGIVTNAVQFTITRVA